MTQSGCVGTSNVPVDDYAVLSVIKKKYMNVRLAAVFLGVMTAITGGVGVRIMIAIYMVASGIPPYDIMPRLNSTSGLLLKSITDMGFTILGASLAANLARQSYRFHGALVAFFAMLCSVPCHDSAIPDWYWVLHYMAMFPAGIIGGYLVKRQYRDLDHQRAMHGRS